jgi:predicted DNA-binding transcriptional regulator AlpA
MAEDFTLTVNQFCAVENISRAMLYRLWADGKGPRRFFIGNSPRISHEARTEWRRKLEAEAAEVEGVK